MRDSKLDRREFHQLTAAAFGGIVAGAVVGCGGSGPKADTTVANADLHLCRGLNECQGKGAGGANTCRGLGACATSKKHECATQNECKGFGGCGEDAGRNACKGKGGCSVPLMDEAWKSVRGRLETKWKEKQQKFGDAPAKPEPPKPDAVKPEEPKAETKPEEK
jgi:hypothetical protein